MPAQLWLDRSRTKRNIYPMETLEPCSVLFCISENRQHSSPSFILSVFEISATESAHAGGQRGIKPFSQFAFFECFHISLL